MKPIIITSDKFLDWKGSKQSYKIAGTFIFPFIILRKKPNIATLAYKEWHETKNHENIHFVQCIELYVFGFLFLYGLHYLIGRLKGLSGYEAYKNVIFEKEANEYEGDLKYLNDRPKFNWLKQWRTLSQA